MFENISPIVAKHLSKIKNNIQLILLIPTVLGGLWQVLELSFISTSYIRFFSVSQLISDGILILFVLSFSYTAFYLPNWLINTDDFKNDEEKSSISGAIFTITFFSFVFWLTVDLFSDSVIKSEQISFFTLLIGLVFIVASSKGIYVGGYILYYKLKKKKSVRKLNVVVNRGPMIFRFFYVLTQMFLIFLVSGTLLFTFVISLSAIFKFRDNILIPEKLKNIEFVKCSIANSNKYKSVEIIYFNDKYIFTEVKDDKKNNSYLVLEFDVLFKNEDCNHIESNKKPNLE